MNHFAAASVTVALGAGIVVAAAEVGASRHRPSRGLLAPLGLEPWAVAALAPLCALALYVTSVGLVGRLFGAFDAGLLAGALAEVGLGIGVVRSAREVRSPGASEARRPGARGLGIRIGLALATVAAGYIFLATKYQMHDEHALFGHKSMVEELRRGYYPPYAPPVPEVEGRYHFAFDLLAGALARGYGVSADSAIDAVTVVLALSMSLGSAALMVDLGAAAAAPFAALAIHLGAGLAAISLAGVAGRHPRCLIQYHHPSCGVELFPTQLLNVFQHPVSLGVPLFLALLLLAPRVLGRGSPPRASIVLAVVLPALALAQIAYFALGALAVLAAAPFLAEGSFAARARFVGRVAMVLGVGLALAWLLGGMFAPNPLIDSGLIAFRRTPGFPPHEGPLEILRHHAVNLGLAFLLLPYFVVRALRTRHPTLLVLVAFAGGGIVAAQLFVYTRSWDIVKFPSAASFALTLLYAALVDASWADRPLPFRWARRLGRGAVTATGILAFAYLAFPLHPTVRPYDLGNFRIDPVVAEVIAWFDEHPPAREELIYAQSNVATELAIGAGLSVVAQDADLYYLGIREARLREVERSAAEIRARMSSEALRALRVGWIVLSDEEMANLGAPAKEALEDGARFEVAAEFAGENAGRRRRIFRVRGILSGR